MRVKNSKPYSKTLETSTMFFPSSDNMTVSNFKEDGSDHDQMLNESEKETASSTLKWL